MQRIAVIGPPGAGKTRLAEQLSAELDIPVTYLDRIFWRDGWSPAPRAEAVAELERVVAQDRWIIDGDFLEHGSRFTRADTVIFLDVPRWKCIWRVLWRRVRDRNTLRPDLPAPEGLDPKLFTWIWHYPRDEARSHATQILR